ncbi:Phosphoglycolate phosphatase, HAD superfamily [Rhizobium aethiopicum]|uniref:phosphoglycolate phosphatase n=1 Tax=Rhizobium aethiopicum TaxID=1138170 RepID=A0A1C3Y2B0_9HYPH|nr:HAD hydrolase-like protein [Rhizobium aethiopicum]SCB58597.1 Phosphoglycolate phosphatase, HAD superfamily [Rhizobium aethiopicum]
MRKAIDRQPAAIIFDFDGVILDSARAKTLAFASCYEGEDERKIKCVIDYQERNGGIGRRQKFEYFEQHVFGRSVDPKRIDDLCERFASIIDNAMIEAPFVKGAEELLERLNGRVPLHLVSGMPDLDLKRVLEHRSLVRCFASVAGSPKTKIDEFRRILEGEGCAPAEVLAVGDSRTEFDAAVELGIPFLAVVAPDAPDFFPPGTVRCRDLTEFRSLVPLE